MRKTTICTALIALLGISAGSALAGPLRIPSGPIYIKFNNLEQISATNVIEYPGDAIDPDGSGPLPAAPATEGNWGIFDVSSVNYGKLPYVHDNTQFSDFGSLPIDSFWNASDPGEVTGIFYGIEVDTTYAPLPDTPPSAALGGYLDLWWDDNDDFPVVAVPGGRTAQDKFTGATEGDFLARIAFATGHVQGNATNTIFSSVDLTSIGGTFDGKAFSYGNIVDKNGDGVIDELDGVWAGALDQDWLM